ncbi:HAD hydrolase-like protein [Belnapia rosea]|uniref:Phosphoglycolate phosphatase n=1 Tax=Belnapia rosea TaxID=938405 RepID=A0A1G6R657_9PROT|nr:HAD hydrolase-like protein [Belnapia rosea]SDC99517.1 phosphoglycolate phosphatase [Belnapia rosea]
MERRQGIGYKLAIFDVDGTLANSLPWFAEVLNDTADRFGFRRTDAAEREALRALGAREIIRRLGVPPWKLPLIARHMRRQKALTAHRVPLFEGASELLRQLARRGITLAIVSSDSEASIRVTLGPDAALISYFECSAALFGKRRKLLAILRRAGVPAGDAIYIADELRDAEAAQEAGIAFGAVAWGYATPAALEARHPLALFHDFDGIAARL